MEELPPTDAELSHDPVMVSEVCEALNIQPDGIYIDATFGRGGHAAAILKKLGSDGRLIALDRDEAAAERASTASWQDPRFTFKKALFREIEAICVQKGIAGKVDGVLMDIGLSSPQLDDPKRGFSFLNPGPLDMRMDQTEPFSAKEWVNKASEFEIARVLKEFGEERFYQKIAHAIILARRQQPIETTLQLASIIAHAKPLSERSIHPATQSFQAIRIVINRELEELSLGLKQSMRVLKVGGRLAVLSYHSLEDRMVKHFMAIGKNTSEWFPYGKKRKATEVEIMENRRARSAILRVAEKGGGV